MPASRTVCILDVWLPQPWGHGVQTACGAVEQWRAVPAVPPFAAQHTQAADASGFLLLDPKTTTVEPYSRCVKW